MKKLILALSIAAVSCGDGNTADEERGERSTYEMANSDSGQVATQDSIPNNANPNSPRSMDSSPATIDSSKLLQ